jgi:integrase
MEKRRTTPAPTPDKPWPGFPLFWHKRGYWCCKRGGKHINYTADADESFKQFQADELARSRGESPPSRLSTRHLLRDAINVFLTRQMERHADGEIGDTQFIKYRRELQVILPKVLSLNTRLADFADWDLAGPLFRTIRTAALARGLQVAQRHITYVRAMLDYCSSKKRMLPPPYYGDDFAKPGDAQVWKQRRNDDAKHGGRAWSLEELQALVAGAAKHAKRNPHLYAHVLLGVFCAFGSGDISSLPIKAVDLDKRTIKFPRVKTGRPRLNPLPPVLVDALKASGAKRGTPADARWAHLFFLGHGGKPCNFAPAKTDADGVPELPRRNDTIARNFNRLLARLKLKKRKTGFYSLRAMFRSLAVGGGDADLIAVVMGRRFAYPVDDYYLRGELREKLFALVEHVERQVFTQSVSPPAPTPPAAGQSGAPFRRARKPRA